MGSTAMAMVVSGTVFSLTQSSFPVATTRQLICHKPAASLLNCRAELSSQGDSDRRRTEPGSWSRKSPSSPGLLPPPLGSRSAHYNSSGDYVYIEPGQEEIFLSLEELRARLRRWLETWPDSNLPSDLARYSELDDAVTYLVESACELEVNDRSGTVQWFEVQVE